MTPATVTELHSRRLELWETMWFFPRQSALVILAIIAAVILVVAADFEVKAIFSAVGGVVFVVLLLAVVFDLWEPPER